MSGDSLGDRMKEHENKSNIMLPPKHPVIGRLDGKAFHTFTKGFERPWDPNFIRCMEDTAKYLCENIQGCKIAYVQSDEISVLLTDFEKENTQGWFDYKLQKMVSISASLATGAFLTSFFKEFEEFQKDLLDKRKIAAFDSRFFSINKMEVNNYFHWRQSDAIRNSVQMLARHHFSHKKCHRKSNEQLKKMLIEEKGVDWKSLPTNYRRGTCVIKVEKEEDISYRRGGELKTARVNRKRWVIDREIPLFLANKEYVNSLLY